jgi:hypothetical protein
MADDDEKEQQVPHVFLEQTMDDQEFAADLQIQQYQQDIALEEGHDQVLQLMVDADQMQHQHFHNQHYQHRMPEEQPMQQGGDNHLQPIEQRVPNIMEVHDAQGLLEEPGEMLD